MISKDTCAAIWSAYREIEAGEKLLADMQTERERQQADPHAPHPEGRLRPTPGNSASGFPPAKTATDSSTSARSWRNPSSAPTLRTSEPNSPKRTNEPGSKLTHEPTQVSPAPP
jgi:hypothetical protein